MEDEQDAQESQVPEEDADKEFLHNMRGWLMTVGTLFVGIAFQAALQPPAWMAELLRNNPFHGLSSHATLTARGQTMRAVLYVLSNAVTFASAVSLVLLLLGEIPRDRAKRTMNTAAWMMVNTGLTVMFTFALGSYEQWFYTLMVSIIIVLYPIAVFYRVRIHP